MEVQQAAAVIINATMPLMREDSIIFSPEPAAGFSEDLTSLMIQRDEPAHAPDCHSALYAEASEPLFKNRKQSNGGWVTLMAEEFVMIKASLKVLVLLAVTVGTIPLLGAYSASLIQADGTVAAIEAFPDTQASTLMHVMELEIS